jgi:transcriptional regulator with GAF, ATPase, and Fis domain
MGSAPGPTVLHGRYAIRGVAGRGAGGCVLEVDDLEAGARRALKVAAPGAAAALLLDEIAELARLRHPALPEIYDAGRTREPVAAIPAGAPYFVAAWIEGGRCDARPLPEPRGPALWGVLADVAGALATIHAAGLVHADVAPQNVLWAGGGRAALVDLGLARGAGARGTPAYMAPEALAGAVEPRGDLYGLGAVAIRLVTGAPPFEAAALGDLVRQILEGPEAGTALPGIPAALGDLVRRLVARDPDARPASALAVLEELDQLAPAVAPGSPRRARPAWAPPPGPTAWPGAEAWIAGLTPALAGGAVVVIAGGAAADAPALAAAALRRHQLAALARGGDPPPLLTGALDEVARALGVAAASAHAWIEHTARAARAARALVVLDLEGDPRARDLVAALGRAPPSAHPVIACVDAAALAIAAPLPEVAVYPAPQLDAAGVAALAHAMLGAAPPRAWAAGLHAASGGSPSAAIALLQAAAAAPEPLRVDWTEATAGGLAARAAATLRGIPPEPRWLAAALAAWGGAARIDRALATLRAAAAGAAIAAALPTPGGDPAALARGGDPARPAAASLELPAAAPGLAAAAALERAGLARRRGDHLALAPAAAAAVVAEVGDEALARLAAVALDLVGPAPADVVAPLLERAPLDEARAGHALAAADELLARGRPERARALALRAAAAAPGRAHLLAARAATAQGSYADAIALARAAAAAGADPAAAELVAARAAQRAGDLDLAEAALARLHAAHPAHAEIAGTYARLLVTRARYAEARAVALAPTAGGAPSGLCAEAAGLAALYLGQLDAADAAFAALELEASTATSATSGAARGRARSLRGMVAQHRGQLALAGEHYREAARLLDEAGEVHAAATAELNLGTVLSERGRPGDALPRLAAAGRALAALGASTEQIAAELNRGNALLALGQPADALVAAEAALALAAGAPHLRAFALLVGGDARRRLGDGDGALAAYRDALAIGVARSDVGAQLSAHLALAEAGAAAATPAELDALCASDDDRDRCALAHARAALAAPPSAAPVAALAELARATAAVATRAAAADRAERALRAHALTALLAARAGDAAEARAAGARARAAHASAVAAAAPAFRAALAADPDLAAVAAALAALPSPGAPRAEAPPAPAGASAVGLAQPAALRRLLTLSRRLNTEASVERILDEVIDTAIELTCAERGFLLLRQPTGELAPVVARNFALEAIAAGDRHAAVSRSIAERAAQSGEPALTIDAGIDERFGEAASVAALRLRSVLAVPLRQRGTVLGCIYVDHRLRGGAFDEAAAGVLIELADIAAIAIENARLTEQLRRSSEAVAALAARLSADLADRDAELVRVKAELPDRDRLRGRYERIVGRSPAMIRMLEWVDRAAATALPVVIVGESGTGKELVARALHDHGPRRGGPFVAVNCSAVPEALLESELFGHVRGAFTGADRDRCGLLEVADGGTLFLDEIADTAPAMQAKLLRVLQDGVLRRVGDSRTRTIDVRVVAATQRPLAELVAAGRFREDLRFRIEVIAIAVPPLRERDGDLLLLVTQLVQRLAAQLQPGRAPPRLTRAALRALGQHRWPGNVRELENALARGVAMGGDTIDVGDLPDSIARGASRPEPVVPGAGDDLRLRPALATTERAYVAAAMARAEGNQTVAARVLGLSRFGLQKKLRRLAGSGDGDGDDGDDSGDGDGDGGGGDREAAGGRGRSPAGGRRGRGPAGARGRRSPRRGAMARGSALQPAPAPAARGRGAKRRARSRR